MNLIAHLGHLPYLGAGCFRRQVVIQPQRAGRDNAWPIDLALLDMIPKRDVSFCRSASGKDRRIAGFELSLHLRLLVRSGIDVPVRIDKTWHCRHALCIDGLATRG